MKDVLSFSLDELREEMLSLEEATFRAKQIFDWIYRKKAVDYSEMTNLPISLRERLFGLLPFPVMEMEERQVAGDGTEKFLWKLEDRNHIESVLLRHPTHTTFCISSQVGCALNCSFCATGAGGFARDLSAGEIVGQVVFMEKISDKPVDNIVFMGMGEPFLNEYNVFKAISILHDPVGRDLGTRRFTISTSGIPESIRKLADSKMDVRLSVSLHSARDELRSKLMPVNRKYPLSTLREALEYYQHITGNRITVEYAMIKGVNDSKEEAQRLVEYLRGLKSFINIIPVNPVNKIYDKPSENVVVSFVETLRKAGFESALRHEKGSDIDAACGQLRQRRR